MCETEGTCKSLAEQKQGESHANVCTTSLPGESHGTSTLTVQCIM